MQISADIASITNCLRLSDILIIIEWSGLYAIPTIFMPFLIFSTIYLYFFLRHKEKQYQNFRIKNKFITENIFYSIFSIIISCCVLYLYVFYIISTVKYPAGKYVIYTTLILAFFFNHFFIRNILNKIITKKYG